MSTPMDSAPSRHLRAGAIPELPGTDAAARLRHALDVLAVDQRALYLELGLAAPDPRPLGLADIMRGAEEGLRALEQLCTRRSGPLRPPPG